MITTVPVHATNVNEVLRPTRHATRPLCTVFNAVESGQEIGVDITLGTLSRASMNTTVLRRLGAPRRPQVEAHAGPAEYRSAKAAAAEHAPASTPALQTPARSGASEHSSKAAALRLALVAGSVAATVVAWLAASGVAQAGEPELAVLLRGMAAIKSLLALSAAGLVWWRFGEPVALRVAVGYITCASVLFASTVLIWQLAFIVAAAVLFHSAELVGLVLAMREGR